MVLAPTTLSGRDIICFSVLASRRGNKESLFSFLLPKPYPYPKYSEKPLFMEHFKCLSPPTVFFGEPSDLPSPPPSSSAFSSPLYHCPLFTICRIFLVLTFHFFRAGEGKILVVIRFFPVSSLNSTILRLFSLFLCLDKDVISHFFFIYEMVHIFRVCLR